MTGGDYFVAAVATLEALAGITYAFQRDGYQGVIWCSIAVSNVAYLLMRRG